MDSPECAAYISNLRSSDGSYLLHEAVRHGQRQVVEVLLAAGPQAATFQNHRGETALHLAAAADRVDLIQLLVAVAPETLYYRDFLYMTPLYAAAMYNSSSVIKAIVAAAPGTATDPKNKKIPILHLIAHNSHAVAVEQLLAAGFFL